MIILGIDPGLANTGWGVIEHGPSRARCLAYGCVTTAATDPLPSRLAAVHDEIRDVIDRYSPGACAVESVYFGANAKSAFATGQARGAALLATGCPFCAVTLKDANTEVGGSMEIKDIAEIVADALN